MNPKDQEKSEALKKLKTYLKPQSVVYTVLRHCSRSGMQRSIDLFTIHKGNTVCLSYWAAKLMESRINRERGGIVTRGCGMDMGFHLVYELGYRIWPRGTRKPHSTRNGEPDKDGGYALKHRWL